MKRRFFNFVMYFLPFISFYSVNASEKVDFSDFLTEKNQKPQKSLPYYPTYQYKYEGVNLDEELAVLRKIPEEKPKMHPYYSTYRYLGVNLDEDLAIFRNNKTFYERFRNVAPRMLRLFIFKR